MANKTITMLQLRRIIQLSSQGLSNREISQELQINRNTVNHYLRKAQASGQSPVDLVAMEEEDLALLLLNRPLPKGPDPRLDDLEGRMEGFRQELKKRHVTRQVLWEEYKSANPSGYGYSQFCDLLGRYLAKSNTVMDLDHPAAEKMMFDFAGDKLYYTDQQSGQSIGAYVLICVLPCSGMIYAQALASQAREDLLAALNNCLGYFGGVARAVVSDNLGQWVKKANRYEPVFAELANQWSLHTGATLMAARVRKPRDKAAAESSVNTVYNRIYALLRNKTAFSLKELNEQIMALLELLNHQEMQRHGQSRYERFNALEKHLLLPLPAHPFVPQYRVEAKVQMNYHVVLGQDMHFYSVPYRYMGSQVTLVYDCDHVRIYLPTHELIATHVRDRAPRAMTTLEEHRAPNHLYYNRLKGYTAKYFLDGASKIGLDTLAVVTAILERNSFVEQNFNSCIGLLRMADKVGPQRMENACKRARLAHRVSYTTVKNILENNLDKHQQATLFDPPPIHANIRGSEAFN